jgi:hypothetical protein
MAQVLLILKHWQSKQADLTWWFTTMQAAVFFHCCQSVHLVGMPLLHDQQPAEKNVPPVCQLVLITLYLYNSLKNIHWKTRLHAWHLFFKGQVKIKYLQCLINNCLLKMSLGCGGLAPHSHEFSCWWRSMVSFISWLLYACGNFWYPLDWRLSWYKHHWDMKVLRKFFASAGIWMSVLLPVVWSLVTKILWLFLRM